MALTRRLPRSVFLGSIEPSMPTCWPGFCLRYLAISDTLLESEDWSSDLLEANQKSLNGVQLLTGPPEPCAPV